MSRGGIFLLFILALGLRTAFVLYHPLQSFLISDVANYVRIANFINQGTWDSFHFFQPIGFPFLLSIFMKFSQNWILPFTVFQTTVSLATVYFSWKSAERLLGKKTGLVALLVFALHVPWILYNGYALSETAYMFLLSLLLWQTQPLLENLTPRRSMFWGLTFFLAFLIKGTHVFLAPIFVIGLLTGRNKRALVSSFVVCSSIGLGLLFHGAFAYQKTGKFFLSASAGGLNFVEGKCPSKKNFDSRGILWWSPLYYQLRMSEEKRWPEAFDNSKYFMKEGLKCIGNRPIVLLESLENIFFLFYGNFLWPVQELKIGLLRTYELAWGFCSLAGIFFYFLGICRTRDLESFLTWGAPIGAIFLCVYVFKGEIRFRIPFDVYIIPVAIKGWGYVLAKERTT
jgi:hypothetical protein